MRKNLTIKLIIFFKTCTSDKNKQKCWSKYFLCLTNFIKLKFLKRKILKILKVIFLWRMLNSIFWKGYVQLKYLQIRSTPQEHYLQIRSMLQVEYLQIRSTPQVQYLQIMECGIRRYNIPPYRLIPHSSIPHSWVGTPLFTLLTKRG